MIAWLLVSVLYLAVGFFVLGFCFDAEAVDGHPGGAWAAAIMWPLVVGLELGGKARDWGRKTELSLLLRDQRNALCKISDAVGLGREGWDLKTLPGLVKTIAERLARVRDVHAPESCDKPECLLCGVLLCPHAEPLHCDKDGCPACEAPP